MDYTSIHIYGHLLSDDVLHRIERDSTLEGNRERDYSMDIPVSAAIDYVWSSLRTDWRFYQDRADNEQLLTRDPYGTRRSRDLIERLLQNLGYDPVRQTTNIEASGTSYDISHVCPGLNDLPLCIIGERVDPSSTIETLDKCSLDYRAKGRRRKKSTHATMLEYLNATEHVYGIISNGPTIRLLRNSGQLVKLTYIEFDLRRMVEEDKYTDFCLMYRILHASRFRTGDDEPCIMERWFEQSIESGNRIRSGLSQAVQRTMEVIGNAVLRTEGKGNDALREALSYGEIDAYQLNTELTHLIYRLIFLFIIEERDLVYQLPDSPGDPRYDQICRWQEIYTKSYAASRLRSLSEHSYLRQHEYCDLWQGLMDTFHLFESDAFGKGIGIAPLGGVLFGRETLLWIKQCRVTNHDLLTAIAALNEFTDQQQRVKVSYSSLDVEEFGSVYEGILEMRPYVKVGTELSQCDFGYVGGLDRQSTASYYTRPDLVQSLIKTTLEPVIEEKLSGLETSDEKVMALLNLRVCDPACGSGHIVLAMARTIAWYICTIRTGEDNPASLDYRQALREVISRCIYAVDYNPDAVELCKVVLWIEGYSAGKPLSFLDHHIRCGNSVVGVTNLQMLLDGVPDQAYDISDKKVKERVLALNREVNEAKECVEYASEIGMKISIWDQGLSLQRIVKEQVDLSRQAREISAIREETLSDQVTKGDKWKELMSKPRVSWLRTACDIYTYAFYKKFSPEDLESVVDETGVRFTPYAIPYTGTVYQALEEIMYLESGGNSRPTPPALLEEARVAAERYRYFHWAVEFPEIFAGGRGFDVICGNPPWDKLQMEDQKWFAGKDEDIAQAPNQATRKRMIDELQKTDQVLYNQYAEECDNITGQGRFIKYSGRFPLTARGKLELSSLFAELALSVTNEAWGLVLPTGIAVNESNSAFFSKLIEENRLLSLYDFENREKLFDIHRMFKFCLLTAGKEQDKSRKVTVGFFLTRLDHLQDPRRIYTMKTSDIALVNPITKTSPIFRTSKDVELTKKIYKRYDILVDEESGYNPWSVSSGTMFNMASASNLFRTYEQQSKAGATLKGNTFTTTTGEKYVPLYEGKMIWHYNHHYGTWPTEGKRPNTIVTPPLDELSDPTSHIAPWYWVPESEVKERLVKSDKKGNVLWQWKHKWLIAFRDVTNATNERTFIPTIIPSDYGVGHSAILLYPECGTMSATILCGMLSSLVLDYSARQKIGGSHASIIFVKQFPVLRPDQIPDAMQWEIVKRVAELTYFNHDLDGWASELWEEMSDEQRAELPQLGAQSPWIYRPERRELLQAELDAIFAHLYGLSTDELRYILDPEDICGEDCVSETFRVLKESEIRRHGEYRTKRLVLEAWHRMGYDG